MPQPKSNIDLTKISIFAWLTMGGGLLALIFSFIPRYYTFNFGSIFGVNLGSYGATAWHNFFGWFGVLLLLAAAAVTSLKTFTNFDNPNLPLGVLAGAGVGFICVLLSLFIPSGISRGFSYWAVLVLAAATAVGALMMYLNAPKPAPAPGFPGAVPAFQQPVAPGFPQPAAPGFPQAAPVYPPQAAPVYPPQAAPGYPQPEVPGAQTPFAPGYPPANPAPGFPPAAPAPGFPPAAPTV